MYSTPWGRDRLTQAADTHGRVCCTDGRHLRWPAPWPGWKDVAVPKSYPREFRDDVVRVARDRDAGVTVEQIANDFGVHPMTSLQNTRVSGRRADR
jgi:hypothetical protein